MAIDWAPATEADEIRQCVRTLLATTPGTVPYARGLGVEGLVDEPMPRAAQIAKVRSVRAMAAYEPRAKVRTVTVTGDADGHLRPDVTIEEVRS